MGLPRHWRLLSTRTLNYLQASCDKKIKAPSEQRVMAQSTIDTTIEPLAGNINSNYGTFRNSVEESVFEQSQRHQERCSGKGCMDFWLRLLSCLVSMATLAVLITFIVAYCKDTGFNFNSESNIYNPKDMCTVEIKTSDEKVFEDFVVDRSKDVLYVNLATSEKMDKTEDTDIYRPEQWIWAHGDSAILAWPASYELWSFGILDLHTARNVSINLELKPSGCSFVWGSVQTTIAVGTSLLDFTKTLFPKEKKLKHSKWCYKVRLRDIHKYPVLEQDFSFFVQDVGYKCCQFHRNESGDLVPICDGDVIVERLWTDIPFVFAFITLVLSPNLMVFVYQFLSFKSHVYWIHNKHKSHNEYASNADEWVYTDYKSPISFLSFLKDKSSHNKDSNFSYGLKRFFKYVFIAIIVVTLSLSVIILSLILCICDETSYNMLRQEIHSDIPLGFLSLLFPFQDNYDNFMSHLNGPYVFIALYCGLAVGYLFVFGYSKPRKGVQDYSRGHFSLNLDLVEKYGRIRCTVRHKYGLFESIHANSRAILHKNFWNQLIVNRLIFGKGIISLSTNTGGCQQIVLNILKSFLLFFSILFSVLVHTVPFLFTGHLILTECLRRTRRHWCFDFVTLLILSSVHFVLVFCFTIIFFGSAEFIFLMFSFCVLSIILFPGAASGIFVFVLVAVYYIVERLRSVAMKYAVHRDLAISVSQDLCDKCKGAEARLSEDANKLFIAGTNMNTLQCIVIMSHVQRTPNGPGTAEDDRKQTSFHCHLKDNTLKIIGRINDMSMLQHISISGVIFKIVKDSQQDLNGQKQNIMLLHFESAGSQLILVQQKTADNIIPEEDDTCYVTYRNGLPGIPWELLNTIVEEYIPACAERLQAAFWTILVCAVIKWLSIIIKRFDQWDQMTTIVNALIVVLLVKMSDITKMLSVDVGETQRMNILRSQFRLTVQEYWMRKKYGQNEDTPIDNTTIRSEDNV